MAHDPRCDNVQRHISDLARNLNILVEAVEEIAQKPGLLDDLTGERVDDLLKKIKYD